MKKNIFILAVFTAGLLAIEWSFLHDAHPGSAHTETPGVYFITGILGAAALAAAAKTLSRFISRKDLPS